MSARPCKVKVGDVVQNIATPCACPYGAIGKVKDIQWISERRGGYYMISVTWKLKSKENKSGFRSWTLGGMNEEDLLVMKVYSWDKRK
jgi:hypothetical protein